MSFKCKDRTGHTLTNSIEEAGEFYSENDAIDYNHKWLFGEFEVKELKK